MSTETPLCPPRRHPLHDHSEHFSSLNVKILNLSNPNALDDWEVREGRDLADIEMKAILQAAIAMIRGKLEKTGWR